MAKKGSLGAIVFGVALVFVVLVGGIFIMMRRSRMMGAFSQASVTGLVAVSANGTPVPVPTAQAAVGTPPENTAQLESDGLLISLTLNPYPLRNGQPSDFEVSLTDTSGQAISDAAINLDLTMPAMWMPPNKLNMEPLSAGKYRATGYFTMRGLWRIEVIITRGDQKQSVFFDIGL